jgi:hypothetical protein
MKLLIFLATLLLPIAATAQTATAPSGSVTSAAGTWTFGSTITGGGYPLLLNGALSAPGAAGVEYEIAAGQVYVENNLNQWFEWNGAAWVLQSGAPSVSASGIVPLTGSVSLSAPLANYYQMNSSQSATVTLPACSALPPRPGIFWETLGAGSIVLQESAGWVNQPPGAQTVGLWAYGPNATAYTWADSAGCHISFGGGAPPAP